MQDSNCIACRTGAGAMTEMLQMLTWRRGGWRSRPSRRARVLSLVIWRCASASVAAWREARSSSLIRRAPADTRACSDASATLHRYILRLCLTEAWLTRAATTALLSMDLSQSLNKRQSRHELCRPGLGTHGCRLAKEQSASLAWR